MPFIAHFDLDAFFASVEQLDHPELRGQPVIVGGLPSQPRGVVCAASYEARKFGVRSAMPVRQASALCPQGVFLVPRFARYSELSRQVMQIFAAYTDVIEPLSLDEAFLDLSAHAELPQAGLPLLKEIKARIRKESGLTVSAGGATSKSVAKIASDLEKPNGLVVCPAGKEKIFLSLLPVERLWGAGRKTCAILKTEGIRTIGQLAATPLWRIRTLTGNKMGNQLWELANGIDHSVVKAQRERKSIGAERTLSRDSDDPALALALLEKLTVRIAAELQQKHLHCRTLTLKIRYADFTTIHRSSTLREPGSTLESLFEILRQQFLRLCGPDGRIQKKIRLIGLSVSDLSPASATQLLLFA